MRVKKVPGKVGKFPTHMALVCSKVGCNGKLRAIADQLWDYECIKCGMRVAKVGKLLDPGFQTYYYSK